MPTDRQASVAAPTAARRGRPARFTSDELLDLVVAEFNARGYDATSMEDLARATGLTKSAVYHHVAGKEALLRLALERAVGAALEGGPVAREAVENDLSTALRRALPLLPGQGSEAAVAELAAAASRVVLARAVHNGVVAETRVLRARRLVRLLHLAGHRVLPLHFDMDDEPPALPPPASGRSAAEGAVLDGSGTPG